MNEFFQEVAKLLTGFPPIILDVLAPIAGSVAAAIVAMLAGEANTPKEVLGQFIVGWLAGAFGGPILTSIIKIPFPPYAMGFVAGGSGYWGMKVYLKKKQNDLLNKPPGEGPLP